MLPAPTFAQAIQNAEPGSEAETMGPYFPGGRYYATTADFERTGCAPPESGTGAGRALSTRVLGARCVARSRLAIRVPHDGRRHVRSVAIYVGGHRIARRSDVRAGSEVRLGRYLHRHGRYTIKLVAHYTRGATRATKRTARVC
jgi:hypothetical protein